MGSFSIWHWLIVLLVVVLVFGTKKLRNLGADLGTADHIVCKIAWGGTLGHRCRNAFPAVPHQISLR